MPRVHIQTSPHTHEYQDISDPPSSPAPLLPCRHRGEPTGALLECEGCGGKTKLKVYACTIHERCVIGPQRAEGVACCTTCPDRDPLIASTPILKVKRWAYGVTTVPERRDTLLLRTLASLTAAGFDKPRLFIDGRGIGYNENYWKGLEETLHYPAIRTFGNWYLALAELYFRDPLADRYAIFQDDLIACRNLRAYLDTCHYPDKGYWNLLTFPQNQVLIGERGNKAGWQLSDQLGKGAVGLVFSNEAVVTLLTSRHMVERVKDANRGWRVVDGGIVTAFQKAGWQEYVHNPSLIQHTGEVSVMGNRPHPQAPSFPGEDFDALSLASSSMAIGG